MLPLGERDREVTESLKGRTGRMSDKNIEVLATKIADILRTNTSGNKPPGVCSKHADMESSLIRIDARTKHQAQSIKDLKTGQDKMTGAQELMVEKIDQVKDLVVKIKLKHADEILEEAKEEKATAYKIIKEKKTDKQERIGHWIAAAGIAAAMLGKFLENLPTIFSFIGGLITGGKP